jgi:imidazolonepropionase-like amidohydrolase
MSGERLVLSGGSVLDPDSGDVRRLDVAVEDGLVVDVGDGLDGDDGFDCTGVTLVPGLIDCHAHMAFTGLEASEGASPYYQALEIVALLRRTVQLGVTTVRDAWGADAGLRDAIAAGFVEGPRLLVSLAQLCGTGGIGDHFDLRRGESDAFLGSPWLPRGVFDGVPEARSAVRRMIRSGADVIKVAVSGSATQIDAIDHQQVADDELAEIVAEAARHGRFVMAHAHGARTAEAAARAGVRSVEHGAFLDEAAVGVMADRGTWLVPTLSPVLGGVAESDEWRRNAGDAARRSFRLALDAGIPIAMGTDCPASPHEDRLDELTIMHELGMPAADVWRSATSEAARLLHRADLGVIETGRRADMVAISGDIMDLTDLASRIGAVWKDGRRVSTPSSGD